MGFEEPVGDIFETKKEVVITVELHSIKENTIRIDVQDDCVIVYAKRNKVVQTQKTDGKQDNFEDYRVMLDLPAPVEKESMKKTFHNGVLEVRLQKQAK